VTESSGALSRLGNVLYWLCTGVAMVFGIVAILLVFGRGDEKMLFVGFFAVLAIVVWLIGRAARYILAGK